MPETVADLAHLGIVDAFPIQEMTLPVALSGHDVIGQAKTGTGKTLGFAVPLLQRIVAPGDPGAAELATLGTPQALVVLPTRELAIQVANEVRHASRTRGVRVLTVYGGRSYEPQIDALRSGVEVVVGTPGRLLDLVEKAHLDLSSVRVLVLDEADEMLDMGFLPDVERIVGMTPGDRQTMLFSATMPGEVVMLARRYMNQPTNIRAVSPDDDSQLVKTVEQHAFRSHPLDKPEMTARILQAKGRGHTMVFCRTKRQAQKLADELTERGFAVGAVHGDLGQGAREQAMRAFRSGKVDVLVATDVAARGIDVEGITHVINYSAPEDDKTYVHRIGRTGRAGASGVAITYVDWEDVPRWNLIVRSLGIALEEPRETYSTSPHLFEELGIDPSATGVLPRSQRTLAGLAAEEVEDLGETGRHREPSRGRGHERGREPALSAAGSRGERPARDRNRRRTRAGQPADSTSGAPAEPAGSGGPDGGTSRRPRRRRRRGPGSGSQGTAAGGSPTGGDGPAPA